MLGQTTNQGTWANNASISNNPFIIFLLQHYSNIRRCSWQALGIQYFQLEHDTLLEFGVVRNGIGRCWQDYFQPTFDDCR